MAVTSMQAINVIGLMNHIDEVITVLGESGAFHPDEVSNFYDNTRDFTRLQANNIYAEPLTELKISLNQTKKKFELRDTSDYCPGFDELEETARRITAEVDRLTGEISKNEKKLSEAKEGLAAVSHFKGLGADVEKALRMRFIDARFGRLPKDSLQKLEAYRGSDYAEFEICTEDKSHYWGVYFAPKEYTEEIDRIFEGLYFERSHIVFTDKTPAEMLEEYKRLIPEYEKDLRESKRALEDYLGGNRTEITLCLSKLEELYLYAGIRNKALQYKKSFIIVGWIPEKNAKALRQRLSKIKSVELDFSDAKGEMEKSPPVMLKNHFWAKPFEFFTEMYGMPKYNEIDPTAFIAITYTLMFGIMFADLGQGLCLSLVGWLMWKLKKMKIGKVLIPCGIFSAVMGAIFGSVFGYEELLNPLYIGIGLDGKPFEVMSNTNTIIIGAVCIGIVLELAAMLLNVYSSFKQRDFGRALFSQSGIAGILFYNAIVFGLIGELFLGLHLLTLPYILGMIVLPFLLIYFDEPLVDLVNGEKDWMPESWGGYIVEKFFEMFEVLLGYVTNTMSFLRVGVFVLVHAGMMTVVFVLANTAGGVGYWIIVVLGNALIMALEALLVSIQVLRLEYYEMFSRFYSGEGRTFEPVKLKINK